MSGPFHEHEEDGTIVRMTGIQHSGVAHNEYTLQQSLSGAVNTTTVSDGDNGGGDNESNNQQQQQQQADTTTTRTPTVALLQLWQVIIHQQLQVRRAMVQSRC